MNKAQLRAKLKGVMLLKAAEELDLQQVEAFLLDGADANMHDSLGNSAIMLAMKGFGKANESVDAEDAISGRNQQIDDEYKEYNKLASKLMYIVELLLTAGCNINAANKHGDTPLLRTPIDTHANKEILQRFIAAGANVGHCNNDNRNILHQLVLTPHRNLSAETEIFTMLQDKVNPNVQDSELKRTPLMWLFIRNSFQHSAVIKLINIGSDVTLTDSQGRKAADFVDAGLKSNPSSEIMTVLRIAEEQQKKKKEAKLRLDEKIDSQEGQIEDEVHIK